MSFEPVCTVMNNATAKVPTFTLYTCVVCTTGHCNPPYVSELLLKLGQSWRELALYLGYSEMEVEAVTRAGGGDPGRQVLMLLRVWWMPDCGKEKTQALLNKGIRLLIY